MELIVDIKKKLPGFLLNVKFSAGLEALGLLGASGAGKTMTLLCIAGIQKPDSGKIVLNGQVLYDSGKGINLPIRDRKIGFLFQNYALFPHMTVEENIGFGLGGLSKSQRNDIVHRQIQMIKLEDLKKRYPFQLSGGQQQRVALARALAIEPQALLLDEPFSALDDYLRNQMVKQLVETTNNYNGITLFISHNVEEVYRICGQLVVLADGQVEAHGTKESIFLNPPSLATARITGCKNFSAARWVSMGEVEALDWGVKLKASEPISTAVEHVGFRARYLKSPADIDLENVFCCWPSDTSETPFGMTVYLSLERRPIDSEDYHLQWEMPKEQWLTLKDQPLPWKVYLNPEKVILVDR
jgi:ABC-type sulfate/molybdate transport systems ATPase subunit